MAKLGRVGSFSYSLELSNVRTEDGQSALIRLVLRA